VKFLWLCISCESGDLLRKKLDPTYKCFSVPLENWVSNLIMPPTKAMEEPPVLGAATKILDSSPSVSFIQVCRNYLRLYQFYENVTNERLLKSLYESGTAFFAFPNCPDYDILASIRYSNKGRDRFAPLLISVKARDVFNPGDAEKNCSNMEEKLKRTGCHRALALVLVIGSSVPSNDNLRKLATNDIVKLFDQKKFNKNMVMAKVLRVGIEDAFGISKHW